MFGTDPRLIALRDSLPGKILRGSGRVQYHLRERIGEGGQGWVFTANWDEPSGFVVIAKVLRPDAVTEDTLRRFQREADVLRMLSQSSAPNPHIVRFYDHATATFASPSGGAPFTLPFTILEYVNGLTLEAVLDAQGGKGLAVERTRRILRQVTQALEIVHAKKVIHRDLKPSNILLALDAGTEVAKVTDFGLVKLADVNMARTTTLAGASLGYAPPEQYEQGNKRVSERTDIFSLAAITFEMLTGRMAFPYRDGENPLLIVTRILNETRPTLASCAETLPPQLRDRPDLISVLDTHIIRALSADPMARHANVAEFFGAVEPLLRAAADLRTSNPPPSRALPFSETVPASMNAPSTAGAMSAAFRPSHQPFIIPVEAPRASFPSPVPDRGSFTPGSVPVPLVNERQSNEYRSVRPSGDTSNPALWSWRVVTPSLQADVIRSACFAADGQSGVAIGPKGLARWERSMWIGVPLPSGFDPRRARTVALLPNGDVLLAGDGLAMRFAASGAFDVLTSADPEVIYRGVMVENDGTVTLVGDRPDRARFGASNADRVGCAVQYQGSRLTMLADAKGAPSLRSVARVGNGHLACGDRGSLVSISQGSALLIASLCSGELHAIASLPGGGAVTVGTGGHALAISPDLAGHLEAVQTTCDLLSLAVTEEGTAWAGATKARIVRRTGSSWVRMSAEVGVSSAACAMWVARGTVRALCDDGAVLEGRLP